MSDDIERISYALSKQVPDMARGFTIHTNYGDLEIDAADAELFVVIVEKKLEKKLLQAKKIQGLNGGN